MSSIFAFDILENSKTHQDAGMDHTLADVIARRQGEAFEEILDARQLVTKQDLLLEIEKIRSECLDSALFYASNVKKARQQAAFPGNRITNEMGSMPVNMNPMYGVHSNF